MKVVTMNTVMVLISAIENTYGSILFPWWIRIYSVITNIYSTTIQFTTIRPLKRTIKAIALHPQLHQTTMTIFITLQLSNIWGRIWVWIWGGNVYLCYLSRTRVLKSGKTQTYTQTQSRRRKSVKSAWVQSGTCRVRVSLSCLCIMGEHSKEEYNYKSYSSLSFILEWLYMHAWNFFGLRFQTQFCNHIDLSKVSIKK
jgi:hypothetical protein